MMVAERRRLDQALVERGLASSRERAQALVRAGLVRVAGMLSERPDQMVAADQAIELTGARVYVSRGGEKLAAALDTFAIDPRGRRVLDVGASTGGFTDVLLQRGAERVIAVDVGYGQLAWSLRQDPRVTVLERVNIHRLDVTPGQLREALRCDAGEWLAALDDLDQFFEGFGPRLPAQIAESLAETRRKFGSPR